MHTDFTTEAQRHKDEEEIVSPGLPTENSEEPGIGTRMRDKNKCFNCGLCVSQCSGGAFQARLGAIRLGDKTIPIQLRQSDRARAMKLAERLKEAVLNDSKLWNERLKV